MEAEKQDSWTILLLPVVLTFVAYLPSLGNEFVWDDVHSIKDNPNLQGFSSENFRWILTSFLDGNWMPLTRFTFALDYLWGGAGPKAYHFTNMILHCLNTALVYFLVLKLFRICPDSDKEGDPERELRIRKGSALLSAIFFGLHPTRVESVAWAFERSNLLCFLFYFTAISVYFDFAQGLGSKPREYFLCLFLFAMALLSKPLSVTLPVVLILFDYWPLKRFSPGLKKYWLEKATFVAMAVISSFVAFTSQNDAGAVAALSEMSLRERILNAFHSVVFYLWKLILPLNLSAFYPVTRELGKFTPANILAIILVLGVSVLCLIRLGKDPKLAVAWAFFLVTLSPVLGIVQVGSQAAADRYLYLPATALMILASSYITRGIVRRDWPLLPLATLLSIVYLFVSIYQIGFWKNAVTLWERVVEISPGLSGMAYSNLGMAYQEKGMTEEALAAYDQAIAIGPVKAATREEKGTLLVQKGQFEKAAEEFKAALALDPRRTRSQRGLFVAYQQLGRTEDALKAAEDAVKTDPSVAENYTCLGASYFKLGQYGPAIENFRKAVSLDPQNLSYWANLASTYVSAKKYWEAIQAYQSAIALNNRDAGLYRDLAKPYEKLGKSDLARQCIQKADSLAAAQAAPPGETINPFPN